MSYLRRRYRARRAAPRAAMGDVSSAISNLFSGLSTAVTTAGNIANDPYLPEVGCLVGELASIKSGQTPTPCNRTQPGLPGGIGLEDAVMPLRAYIYAKENPWVVPAAVLAVLGIPFLVGYSMGKDS